MSEERVSVARLEPAGVSETLAVLPPGRLTWAVGSIHGDAERLVGLHDALARRIEPDHNLVYLGNIVGRGRHVAATVHEVLLFRRAVLSTQLSPDSGSIVFLRGSQEEMWHKLLQLQFAPNPAEVLDWMIERGIGTTVEAYGGSIEEGRSAARRGAFVLSQWTNRLRATVRSLDGHDRLLSTLKRAAYTADGTSLFVSAGVDPARPLAQQADALWWGSRAFERDNAPYGSFNSIIRGFDPQHRGAMVRAHTVSLDGGCGFSGNLIAGCIDGEGRLIETIEA
ncbi:MAG: hypothetical protein U1E66_00565 [Rhodospirillales bacterium]